MSPQYFIPFEVLRLVSDVAYELVLPPSLSVVHPVFYVAMLKYLLDGSHRIRMRILTSDLNLVPHQILSGVRSYL